MSDKLETAWDALRIHQKQCDMDGVWVQVALQAVDETLAELELLTAEVERLKSELDDRDSYYLCDCCDALSEHCVDAGGHMQCPSCTKAANLEAENADQAAHLKSLQNRYEQVTGENERLREALEYIAEGIDAGRHDGLPEECPAHDEYLMWTKARDTLTSVRRAHALQELADIDAPLIGED